MMQVYREFLSLELESLASLLVLYGMGKFHAGIVPNNKIVLKYLYLNI